MRQEINAGFFRKLVNLHGENNVGVAQASAVFIPLLQMKSQLFLGVMALLSGYGALRWHGWLHMEVGDLVMFFFLANFFFDPVQVIGQPIQPGARGHGGRRALLPPDRLRTRSGRMRPPPKPLPALRGQRRVPGASISNTIPGGRC